jgi:hypothetical protein
MKNKKRLFSFLILIFNIIPSLKAENIFDGVYKSDFLLGVNRFFYPDDKCPSKLPITVKLRVEGNNITGNISNNLFSSTQCSNYQKAQIKGEIDDSGRIVKIKFDHETKSGQKEDAYAIEGNLKGELILKSKLRALYRKDAKFFFTSQNPSNTNNEYINEKETNNFKNENEFAEEVIKQKSKEVKEKELQLLKEKELQLLKEKELQLLKEKELKQLKEKELQQLKEKELQKQKRIKKESNLLFD